MPSKIEKLYDMSLVPPGKQINHTSTKQAPWYVVPAEHSGSRGWRWVP